MCKVEKDERLERERVTENVGFSADASGSGMDRGPTLASQDSAERLVCSGSCTACCSSSSDSRALGQMEAIALLRGWMEVIRGGEQDGEAEIPSGNAGGLVLSCICL